MRSPVFFLLLGLTASVPARAVSLDDARALHRAGRLQEAVIAYQALAAAPDVAPEDAGTARNNACVALLDLGDPRAAEEECRSALVLRRQVGDRRSIGRTLNNLGLASRHLGRLEAADRRFEEAYRINVERGDSQAQSINLANRAAVAIVAGAYDRAIALLNATVELAAEHSEEPWAAEQRRVAKLNRGVVLEKLGLFREALELYRELLADAESADPRRRASLAVNSGVIYRNLGDPVTALARFDEAARLYQEVGDRSGLSNAWLNIALARHLNLRQPEAAESAYRQALALAGEGGDRPELMQDLFYLGRLLADSGRLDEAERMFARCLQEAVAAGSAEGRWSALAGLGGVALARDRPLEALEHLERAIGDIESVRAELVGSLRSGFFGDKRPVYAAAVEGLARLDRRSPGVGHARRALELVQRAKARDLLDAFGSEGRPAPPVSAAELERRVGGDTLLELFVGSSELFAWVVAKGGVRLRSLGEAAPILAAATRVHKSLAAGSEAPAADLGLLSASLRGAIDRLPGRGRTLWIAPDGALRYLPFELLELASDARTPLVERVAVAYLPSGSALAWLAPGPRRPALGFAGFADPTVPEGDDIAFSARALARRFRLAPLPAARRELQAVAERAPEPRWLAIGAEASESTFRSVAAAGVGVLHLAAHTVVEEGVERGSALLLAPDAAHDGVVYPDEIASLSLPIGLTVLAACSTRIGAEGNGRALSSLTGSFLASGSAGVVATLWDVGDESTAAFMEQFYFQLGRGVRPAEAMRRAKRRLRADPAWSAPSLWAGYVLVGEGVGPHGRWPRGWWGGVALMAAAAGWWWLRRRQAVGSQAAKGRRGDISPRSMAR